MIRSKRIISILLLVCTVSLCWSCSDAPTEPATEPTVTETITRYYEFQGIRAGMEWAEALAVFGQYETCIQEDSTVTIYTYPHFMVLTAQEENQEIVTGIRFRSSDVETARGSVIGDSKETIIKKEGKDYVTDGYSFLSYRKEKTVLSFMLDEDGSVYAIEYGRIVEE